MGLYTFFFFFLPELVIQRYGHRQDIIQKKKKRKINSWKKWNPDRILFTFKTQQKCQKTHFCLRKMKVQTLRNKEHTCLFSDQKKSKLTHQHSFYLSSCARSQLKKKKKNDISTVPPVRTLVLKNSTMTHSLHSFKSPDIILSATRRPKTKQQQQKAPAPKIMQTKQRFARALSAPHNRTKPWTSRNRIYPFRQVGGVRWKRWTQRKRGRFPWERGFPSRKEPRNHLTPRPVGPKNAPGAKRDGAQTDKTQGYGKVMCKLEPSLPLSLFIHQ